MSPPQHHSPVSSTSDDSSNIQSHSFMGTAPSMAVTARRNADSVDAEKRTSRLWKWIPNIIILYKAPRSVAGGTDIPCSVRRLTKDERRFLRELTGHCCLSLPLLCGRKNPQILLVENHHSSRTAHVIVLTPQHKEAMESFLNMSGSGGGGPMGGRGAVRIGARQVFQLVAASDQFRQIWPGGRNVFEVDPSSAGLSGNHRTHVAVLFKESKDDPYYFLSQLADVNAKRNAFAIQSDALENGAIPKPKVSLTMETTGKWTIRSYEEVPRSSESERSKNNRLWWRNKFW